MCIDLHKTVKHSVVFRVHETGSKMPVRLFTEAEGGHEAAVRHAKSLPAFEVDRENKAHVKKYLESGLGPVFISGPVFSAGGAVVDFEDGFPVSAECHCDTCTASRAGRRETKKAGDLEVVRDEFGNPIAAYGSRESLLEMLGLSDVLEGASGKAGKS